MKQFLKNAMLFIAVVLCQYTVVNARESSFTKKGTGPLYWSSYELMHDTMAAIGGEIKWQRNINMVANSLQPHYKMVCTDGGLENSQKHTPNGYIISYSDEWTHSFKDWSDSCKAKGLELGIYMNPLWVTRSARDDANATIINTTNISVRSITNDNDKFNSDLYWVDVTKPGAKEYVQGYVKYFGDMGVKFLRIDFLSWYENGMDKDINNNHEPIPYNTLPGFTSGDSENHGTANYQKALQWMMDAAGDTIELSLVMPHLFNNASSELSYGDMFRINEDCAEGGWDRFSDWNRGIHWTNWSQFSNAFDGLIYWSQFTGKNKMIMDADFLQLSHFSSDDERRSAMSLMAMAGAPIAISTLTNDINSYLSICTNANILQLNKDGFVGKPIKSDVSDTVNSQRWIGMQTDGSWIVGLFNRENETQPRSIYFDIDMGINGSAAVKDLWTSSNLGNMSNYGFNVPSHGCKILKISPNNPQINNGGFETRDISGWSEWHPTGQNPCFGVDNNDFYTGQNKLYFWNDNAYSQSVHQIKTGLRTSYQYYYEVTAKIKTYGNTPNTCRMEIVGANTAYKNVGINNSWSTYSSGKFRVKSDGSFDLGFYIDSPGATSMQIDDVQLHCYYKLGTTFYKQY